MELNKVYNIFIYKINILLILAVVAISAVSGDGILSYAQNAKTDYQAAQVNEQETLNTYYNWLVNEVPAS